MTHEEKMLLVVVLAAVSGLAIAVIRWLQTPLGPPPPKPLHRLVRRWCRHDGRYFVELHDQRIVSCTHAVSWRLWPSGGDPFPLSLSLTEHRDIENFIKNSAPEYRDRIRCEPEDLGLIRNTEDDNGNPQ